MSDDPMVMGRMLLNEVKKYAIDAGHGCEMISCEHVTMGFSCSICLRKLCNTHLYFSSGNLKKPLQPICPTCIVSNHPDLFETEYDELQEEESEDSQEAIDVEYDEL